MRNPETTRAYIQSEAEALEPLDFVVVVPVGRPQHVVEITRGESGGLEVRVPGRPKPLPPLEGEVRSRLRDRGFSSEDPSDQKKPWCSGAVEQGVAAHLAQTVLEEVFEESPDASLDIGHGSHRAEIDAQRKLTVGRRRIEEIVTDVLGHRAEQDDDGDFILPLGEVHVTIAPRATPDGQIIVRIFAITNVGVTVAPELGLFLARLNFGLMFGRFALDAEHRAIWFDETLLGEQFREEELRLAIRVVSTTADTWDDRLKQMFGGATYQEVLEGRSTQSRPPTKPGEGGVLYL